MFLFVQLVIAVVLLHAAALATKRVEIPAWDIEVGKKLVPVILVNVIGLVFNTLCLRGVEASFFQVPYTNTNSDVLSLIFLPFCRLPEGLFCL